MRALNRGGNDNEILRVFTSAGFANLPVSRANAYRSCKWGPVFPVFLDKRLAVEIGRAKLRGAKFRSSISSDRLERFSGKVRNFF
jgi:hypothetical protein